MLDCNFKRRAEMRLLLFTPAFVPSKALYTPPASPALGNYERGSITWAHYDLGMPAQNDERDRRLVQLWLKPANRQAEYEGPTRVLHAAAPKESGTAAFD